MTELNVVTFEEAVSGSTPAVVDFWAGWCMPCKIFAPVLEEVSEQMEGKADFYKLNIDDFGEIASKYGISSIPTVIVFKEGEPVDRMVGVRSKDEVVQMVEKNL